VTPLWRDAPETSQIIERAERTRRQLLSFIAELDQFVSTLNTEIDEQEEGEE
jgi:hypothetical protein